MQVEKRVLHVSEAAAILSCSSQTVYQLIHTDVLPAFKTGKAWKIPASAIEEYINFRLKE